MAFPVGTATFDKSTYAPGELMTLTVTYSDPDNRTGTAEVPLSDGAGNTTLLHANYSIGDPVTVGPVSDPSGVTFTKVSNDGATAVFQGTAV